MNNPWSRPLQAMLVRLFLFVLILSLLPTGVGEAKESLKSWQCLQGRLRIMLPHEWQPADIRKFEGPFSAADSPQIGLARADGFGSVRFIHFDNPLNDSHWRTVKATAKATCEHAGMKLKGFEPTRIGNREFVVGTGSYAQEGRTITTLVAGTELEGRLLMIIFTTCGPWWEELLVQEQLALITVQFREDGGEDWDLSWDLDTARPDTPLLVPAEGGLLGNGHVWRREIPGYGVSLELPHNYRDGFMIPGFEAPEAAEIIYAVPIGLPYPLSRAQLNEDVLRRYGGTLKTSWDVEVDGMKGVMAQVGYDTDWGTTNAWVLLVGNEEKSLKLLGRFAGGAKGDSSQRVSAILMTMQWNPSVPSPGLDDLGYSFTESSRLKLVCRAHSRVILASTGAIIPLPGSATYMTIDRFGYDQPVGDLELFSGKLVREMLGVERMEIVSSGAIELGGQMGYEITGTLRYKNSQRKKEFYQALTVLDGVIYLVQGFQDPSAQEDFFREFSTIAGSLEIPRWSPSPSASANQESNRSKGG